MYIIKKPLRIIFRLISVLIVAALVYIIGILIINSLSDYKPVGDNYEVGAFLSYPLIDTTQHYSIVSWNIGYAGLGRDADFFYDGGSMSKPGKEQSKRYWNGIVKRLKSLDSADILLLQEVDIASSRSYGLDQMQAIREYFPSHAGLFAVNYDVTFVPLPVFHPMGGVLSGLCFMARHLLISAYWRPFQEQNTWPLGLFMPDRCYQVAEFAVTPSRRLYVIHTHNSAFDDGSMRNTQLEVLYREMEHAYKLGHYVIAGGDWNLNPADWPGDTYLSGDLSFRYEDLEGVYGPDESWQLAYDPAYPSNRDVSGPYEPGKSPCTILDYFICSPNINVLKVKTLFNKFEYSDHQPVYLSFTLQP